ncbi:MAG: response regulator, partial [Actinomycetota bacterium]|nr:response regulator [Actinomycetota bacterium]
MVRVGLRSVLEDESDLEVVGEAQNGREAVEMCRRLGPDVVLMDVRMPEMDGLQA